MPRIGVKLIRILIAFGAFINFADGMNRDEETASKIQNLQDEQHKIRRTWVLGGAGTGAAISLVLGGVCLVAASGGSALPLVIITASATLGGGCIGYGITECDDRFYKLGGQVRKLEDKLERHSRKTRNSAYSGPQCPSSGEHKYDVHIYQSTTSQGSLCIYVPVGSRIEMAKDEVTEVTSFTAFNDGKKIPFNYASVYTGGDCPVGKLCCPQLQIQKHYTDVFAQ